MRAIIVLLRILFTILILALFVANLALMMSAAIDNQKPLQIMNNYLVTVDNTDMAPTLTPGSVVIVQAQPTYEMGEVVAFTSQGQTVIHRIVGTNIFGFITQGDAKPETDDVLLTDSEILGEAVFYLPSFAPILKWLVTPICTGSLVVVWLLLIFIPMKLEKRNDSD